MQSVKTRAVDSKREKVLCRAKVLADELDSKNRLGLLVADLKIKELKGKSV